MKVQNTSLQVDEKNSFPHSPLCIFPSFSQKATGLLLSKRLWKSTSTISFRKYKQKALLLLLVIYLFIFTIYQVQLSHVEYGILRCLVHDFCETNWNSSFLSIQRLHKNILLFAQPVCFDIQFIIKT